MTRVLFVVCAFLLFQCPDTHGRFLVVPEDVAMLFTTIYGFAPPIHKGNDHRIGFGYRFGNHADIQVLYEFGPQTTTKELQSINVRSLPLSDRKSRKPLLDVLARIRPFKDESFNDNVVQDEPKTEKVQ